VRVLSLQNALAGLGRRAPPEEARVPTVPVRRSVQRDYVVCLECGFRSQSLRLRLGRWDLAALPPFLSHEIFNNGPGDCHVQTLLAKPQPLRPQYADPELLELQAAQG
jgi:hypothetical protein